MSIESILRERSIPYRTVGSHQHVRSGWIGVDCPFCGSRNKFHLGINLNGRFGSCWKCGPHSLVQIFTALLKVPQGEARRLVGLVGGSVSVRPVDHVGKFEKPKRVGALQPCHVAYLRRRGFDPNEIKRLWSIQGIGLDPDYAWRIWIPIRYGSSTVSWSTRSIDDDAERRYINAPARMEAMPAKRILYGMEYARSTIIVVEGFTDAWRLGPGTVATMGLQYTQEQIKLMLHYPIRYICFDSSPDAVRRSQRLADQLSLFPGRTSVLRLDADDPGCASKKEVAAVRRAIFGE